MLLTIQDQWIRRKSSQWSKVCSSSGSGSLSTLIQAVCCPFTVSLASSLLSSRAEHRNENYFNLNPATTGLNTASVYIGRIIGLAFSGYCTDKFGRRPTIFIGSAITIVGIIIQAASQNIGRSFHSPPMDRQLIVSYVCRWPSYSRQ